jgi:hypothetical protein
MLRANMGGNMKSGATYQGCGPVHKNARVLTGISRDERWRSQIQETAGQLSAISDAFAESEIGGGETGEVEGSNDTGFLRSDFAALERPRNVKGGV